MLFVPDLQLFAWTEVRPGRGTGCASCRTRCRPPCPEHAADGTFPGHAHKGLFLRIIVFFYSPLRSVLPSVRSGACLPPAERTPVRPGAHSGRGGRAFCGRKARPCAPPPAAGRGDLHRVPEEVGMPVTSRMFSFWLPSAAREPKRVKTV